MAATSCRPWAQGQKSIAKHTPHSQHEALFIKAVRRRLRTEPMLLLTPDCQLRHYGATVNVVG